jgi:hypothetical protein
MNTAQEFFKKFGLRNIRSNRHAEDYGRIESEFVPFAKRHLARWVKGHPWCTVSVEMSLPTEIPPSAIISFKMNGLIGNDERDAIRSVVTDITDCKKDFSVRARGQSSNGVSRVQWSVTIRK